MAVWQDSMHEMCLYAHLTIQNMMLDFVVVIFQNLYRGIHFQNPLFLLNTSVCLRGLPFGRIHFENPDLFDEFFVSVGSPLRENPFSESWLVWRVFFCPHDLPFGGMHFQNPYLFEEFCLSAVSPLLGNLFSESIFFLWALSSELWGTLWSSGLGKPAAWVWGNLPGQHFPLPFKILSNNHSSTSLVREKGVVQMGAVSIGRLVNEPSTIRMIG